MAGASRSTSFAHTATPHSTWANAWARRSFARGTQAGSTWRPGLTGLRPPSGGSRPTRSRLSAKRFRLRCEQARHARPPTSGPLAGLIDVRSAYGIRTNFKPATKAAKSVPGRYYDPLVIVIPNHRTIGRPTKKQPPGG